MLNNCLKLIMKVKSDQNSDMKFKLSAINYPHEDIFNIF